MRSLVSFGMLFLLLSTGIVAVGARTMTVVESPRADAVGEPARSTSPGATRRTVRLPPVDAVLDYQIGGPYAPAEDVGIVVRDRHVEPAAGRYNICYVDVFQTQPEAAGWWTRHHPDLLLRVGGALVEDANWPDQYLLDTSTPARRAALLRIEQDWIAGCADRGYDAVEADNLDSWSRSHGRITRADNLAMAERVVRLSHRLGLAVAQKNGAVLGRAGERTAGFDFAIAESCQVYRECGSYTAAYGAHVFEIEYTDTPGAFARACSARGDRLSITLRDRMVVPKGAPGYRSAAC